MSSAATTESIRTIETRSGDAQAAKPERPKWVKPLPRGQFGPVEPPGEGN